MTADDVINIVRKKLSDTNPGQQRWTNVFLFEYLSETLFVTYKKRPDLFLDADAVTPPSSVDALDDVTGVPNDYTHTIADHVCYLALMEDNSDNANIEQAESFKKMYMERLG